MKTKKSDKRINHLEFRDTELVLTRHFIERWKDRVDKNFTEEDIIKYIRSLAYIKWGICWTSQQYYTLDNDIIIIAEKTEGKIFLISTLGRISENPVLSNIDNYSRQVYYNYGKVDLSNKKAGFYS